MKQLSQLDPISQIGTHAGRAMISQMAEGFQHDTVCINTQES